MRHCGRGSGCSQHYLNYDAKMYNSSLPVSYTDSFSALCAIKNGSTYGWNSFTGIEAHAHSLLYMALLLLSSYR